MTMIVSDVSAILYSPNVILPHEEKIIVDDGGGGDALQEV